MKIDHDYWKPHHNHYNSIQTIGNLALEYSNKTNSYEINGLSNNIIPNHLHFMMKITFLDILAECYNVENLESFIIVAARVELHNENIEFNFWTLSPFLCAFFFSRVSKKREQIYEATIKPVVFTFFIDHKLNWLRLIPETGKKRVPYPLLAKCMMIAYIYR